VITMPLPRVEFTTFFSHGTRFVGLSAKRQRELIAARAHATYDADAGTVTITTLGDDDPLVLPVNKHLHRRAITRWCSTLNQRAGSAVD
jgi:hypothetical protein